MPAPAGVDALILCGGLGTRLRPVVSDRAKPMAEVDGKPFLEIVVDRLAAAGVSRFVLCAGHRADTVRRHFASGPGRDYVVSEETAPLGTAGAFKLGHSKCRPGPVLALNGDSLCPLDITALLNAHDKAGASATVAVTPALGRTDGGGVEFDAARRVTAFREKGAAAPAWVNAGVYVLSPGVWPLIPDGRAVSIETETFPALIGKGLYAFPTEAPVYDIGTPERLEGFRAAYRSGKFGDR
ncbi:MAG: NTP transferase domain-containing protein [Elusimicrobia bacterium]|nr:NTP transferase domain-containing protein [Elusimicrobiota bacterium]